MRRPPGWILLLACLIAAALAGAQGRRALQQATSCTVNNPVPNSQWPAGSTINLDVTATGSLQRVDIFLAANPNAPGCKMAEVPATAGQTSFQYALQIPAQASGTLYVYAKAMPTSTSYAALKSAYIPISVPGPGGNIPPIIRLTSPSVTGTYTAPTTLIAAAAACDLDGGIFKVDFFKDGVQYGTATTVPYTASAQVSSGGAVTFTAVATDQQGVMATSAPLVINVNAAPQNTGGGGVSSSSFTMTVVGGSGSGTFSQYTWVNITANPPPQGQVFAGWVSSCSGPCPQIQFSDKGHYRSAVYARSGGYLTMTATYKVDTPVPTPVTSHPRLLITAAQLPQLQSWATPSNPMYASGFLPALNQALGSANLAWSWSFQGGSGSPNLNRWRDTGGDSWEGDHTEAYAMFFAFSSLIHQDMSHAQRAKDMFMWVIRVAAQNGPTGSGPFGSPFFATYNRASHYGDGFGAVYDWLQWWGPSFFNPQEKALVQKVFLMWASAAVSGYMHPAPVGILNDPTMLLPGARGVANNYASAHMRQLAYYALAFDGADDPVVDPALPQAYLGNTLRSYIGDVTGAWLYQKYAIMEPAAVAAAAFGISPTSPNLGSMSGGLSPEGFLYGSSMVYVMQTLQALHNAGWGTVAQSGPQMQLINSTWWDKYLNGFLSGIVPAPFTATGARAYEGSVWQMHNYGDVLRLYIDPPQFDTFGMLGWYDKSVGNWQRASISQWVGANVMLGGMPQLYQRASNIWGNCYARGSILHFLLYDPSSQPASIPDPRPALPTTFIDPSLGRVISRTSWSPQASVFAYKCSWENVNHQLADCGQFELYRAGEYVSKEHSGYASDSSQIIGGSSVLHNTLAIQNTVNDPTLSMPQSMQADEQALFVLGSQMSEGYVNGGDPVTAIADAPGAYTAVHSSFGGLYNRPSPWNSLNAAVDVQHASRTLVWLKADDLLVVYDRATTGRTGRFKRWHMNFIAPPFQSGNTVTATTAANRVTVTSLLPNSGSASVRVQPIPVWKDVADREPGTHMMVVEDTALPADVRFLHVIQTTDPAAPASVPATLLTGSVNGGAFGSAHGALVAGKYAVLFKADASQNAATVSSMTFDLPVGVPKVVVTGLQPGVTYTLNGPAGSPGTFTVSMGPGPAADASGVVVF